MPKPFVKGDPRINRKGRPKKGQTIADAFRELLGEETTVLRGTGSKAIEERIGRLRLYAETIYQRALAGSDAAARLIANYVDGLPPFTGRLGALPDEGDEEPADAEAIRTHLRELIMGRSDGHGGNGSGTKK